LFFGAKLLRSSATLRAVRRQLSCSMQVTTSGRESPRDCQQGGAVEPPASIAVLAAGDLLTRRNTGDRTCAGDSVFTSRVGVAWLPIIAIAIRFADSVLMGRFRARRGRWQGPRRPSASGTTGRPLRSFTNRWTCRASTGEP
jgi:hypothetical protein